ncbi:sensor histidine kinase [Pantoea ananatis]|uniref:sensor histidine kinase n=1 Tax=Pantoea ananas TaxID=553 RepID=UPI00197D8D2A|nr:HAMP domain-containing sensor histidine kinase [Pantoea ananatis]MBN6032462.1 HAMP domain-containing histidine kinase [Pantoea ananatis]
MKLFKPRSLRWHLTSRIITAQIVFLIFLATLQLIGEAYFISVGKINNGTNPWAAANAVAESTFRNTEGRLEVNASPQLNAYLKHIPGFWYVIRDNTGQQRQYGKIPDSITSAIPAMDAVAYADLGQNINKDGAPVGTIQWAHSPAGVIKIMTTPNIPITFLQALRLSGVKNIVIVIFLSVVIVIAMLIVMPWVVRRALTGISRAAADARKIDYTKAGIRLKSSEVPSEISPFIDTVNSAFDRLDKGLESQKRFLIDAAHELRTPITILNTRLSTLPPGPLKNRLLSDAARLTMLTGQLLDVHRIQEGNMKSERVDLIKLTERVVADNAPLAIGAGYDIAFDTEANEVWTIADALAIERAVTNLIQNAIKYGGQSGLISVSVASEGTINVRDEGKGIPVSERERVFEPFHRLVHDGKGTGLGLNLVRKIMALHNGAAELVYGENHSYGAHLRLRFNYVEIK